MAKTQTKKQQKRAWKKGMLLADLRRVRNTKRKAREAEEKRKNQIRQVMGLVSYLGHNNEAVLKSRLLSKDTKANTLTQMAFEKYLQNKETYPARKREIHEIFESRPFPSELYYAINDNNPEKVMRILREKPVSKRDPILEVALVHFLQNQKTRPLNDDRFRTIVLFLLDSGATLTKEAIFAFWDLPRTQYNNLVAILKKSPKLTAKSVEMKEAIRAHLRERQEEIYAGWTNGVSEHNSTDVRLRILNLQHLAETYEPNTGEFVLWSPNNTNNNTNTNNGLNY